MYATTNFKTKKELKLAVANGQKIGVFQPNAMFDINTDNGSFAVEGPHYPKPHSWYASVKVENGYIVKVS